MGSLDFLKPITHVLPEVKSPEKPPAVKERIFWTAIALIAFFVMYNVNAFGVTQTAGASDFLQVVTASRMGSLLTTGIGPIVLASIFLQLFAGAKIIDVDLKDPEQRATFHGVQKLLGILLCFFEALIYVVLFSVVPVDMALFGSVEVTKALVVLQIALGSIVLLYLDEIVSKYGLGSGISLFIAAGVSIAVVGGFMSLMVTPQTGVIPLLQSGGADALPKALIALIPLVSTVIVFFVVVYAEGLKVEIPLAFERARGLGGRFPIKLLYVSNIPVILASALLLNLQFFAQNIPPTDAASPQWYSYIASVTNQKYLMDGLLYFLTPIYIQHGSGFFDVLWANMTNVTPVFGIPGWVHAITYIIFFTTICVVFGQFWVETAGMGSKEVAQQLDSSGLQIPGYRRDPRIVEKVLERYIPVITILGSAFVGLLAAMADFTGALGTGTGILLSVGILYRLYEDLEKYQVFSSYPGISAMLGED